MFIILFAFVVLPQLLFTHTKKEPRGYTDKTFCPESLLTGDVSFNKLFTTQKVKTYCSGHSFSVLTGGEI